MKPLDKVRAVLAEGGAEFATASAWRKLSLAFAAGTLITEQVFNEAIVAAGAGPIMRTHDVLHTAVVGGAISTGEQTIFGLATALAIHNFPQVMNAVRQRFYGDVSAQGGSSNLAPGAELAQISALEDDFGDATGEAAQSPNFGDRVLAAFALGTSITTIIRNADHHESLAQNARTVMEDAGLIGLGTATLAAGATGITNLGRAVGLEVPADVVVNVISSPFFWVGLFAARQFGPKAITYVQGVFQGSAITSEPTEMLPPLPPEE